jgi:Ca2+-binding RTX toxin-like protein
MTLYRGTPGHDRHIGDGRKMFGGAGNDALEHGTTRGPFGEYIWPENRSAIFGEAGNDKLTAYWAEDRLYGGLGDDHLTGNRLYGGEGDDILTGGWTQTLNASGNGGDKARMLGGKGEDTFVLAPDMRTALPDFRSKDDRIVLVDYSWPSDHKHARLDYDRKTGDLSYVYKPGGRDQQSDVVATLDPGTKVKSGDLDLVLIYG